MPAASGLHRMPGTGEAAAGSPPTVSDTEGRCIGFGAFDGGRLVGYITLIPVLIGSRRQYCQLEAFQVSADQRGRGIGRRLFERLCAEARSRGIPALYISAHSSKESQAAYAKPGSVHAREIIHAIANEEPCGVQMEYVL